MMEEKWKKRRREEEENKLNINKRHTFGGGGSARHGFAWIAASFFSSFIVERGDSMRRFSFDIFHIKGQLCVFLYYFVCFACLFV